MWNGELGLSCSWKGLVTVTKPSWALYILVALDRGFAFHQLAQPCWSVLTNRWGFQPLVRRTSMVGIWQNLGWPECGTSLLRLRENAVFYQPTASSHAPAGVRGSKVFEMSECASWVNLCRRSVSTKVKSFYRLTESNLMHPETNRVPNTFSVRR